MIQHEVSEIIASLTMLPMILLDRSKAKDINDMISADGQIIDNHGFKGKTFSKMINKRLPFYCADVLLDY